MKKFVERKSNKLYLDGKLFRFGGPNIYWLGLDENVDGVNYPTPFRIDNVLDTAVEMGAAVIRSHTMGISMGSAKTVMPERGVWNEEAFKVIDYALKAIEDRGLRVIIPLVDNWNYYHGGRETFTNWHGLADPDEFYTNEAVIRDFQHYVHTLIHRVNHLTGTAYKDSPAILAWEVGNELVNAPVSWVERIVNYIKEIDGNHLTMYGNRFGLDKDKLMITNLDILDAHYYPADAEQLTADANAAEAAQKVFVAGEFGWSDGDLEAFLKVAQQNEAVAGTLFWSLFGHHDKGGYVEHYDGFTLHYPGYLTNEERFQRIQQLREHGYKMNGCTLPPNLKPKEPVIFAATNNIRWKGVVGAAYYTIERSFDGEDGPWKVICEKCLTDHHLTFTDSGRNSMQEAWYRIKAYNIAGEEGAYSKSFFSKADSKHTSLENPLSMHVH